jgi:DNA-binding NtrC family response regulator
MLEAEPVLIVCEEDFTTKQIERTVRHSGLQAVSCSTLAEAGTMLARRSFSLVFCQDRLPDGDFRKAIAASKPVPVVVLSHSEEWEPYLTALRAGAFDCLICPPRSTENERILWSALRERSRLHATSPAAAA